MADVDASRDADDAGELLIEQHSTGPPDDGTQKEEQVAMKPLEEEDGTAVVEGTPLPAGGRKDPHPVAEAPTPTGGVRGKPESQARNDTGAVVAPETNPNVDPPAEFSAGAQQQTTQPPGASQGAARGEEGLQAGDARPTDAATSLEEATRELSPAPLSENSPSGATPAKALQPNPGLPQPQTQAQEVKGAQGEAAKKGKPPAKAPQAAKAPQTGNVTQPGLAPPPKITPAAQSQAAEQKPDASQPDQKAHANGQGADLESPAPEAPSPSAEGTSSSPATARGRGAQLQSQEGEEQQQPGAAGSSQLELQGGGDDPSTCSPTRGTDTRGPAEAPHTSSFDATQADDLGGLGGGPGLRSDGAEYAVGSDGRAHEDGADRAASPSDPYRRGEEDDEAAYNQALGEHALASASDYYAGAEDSATNASYGPRVYGAGSYGGADDAGGSNAAGPGRSGAGDGGEGDGGEAAAAAAEALLAAERERHSVQLAMEVRAREELEDMILRIEKHFKAEQAARKKAEELLQAAIAAELDAKNRLEDVLKMRREEQRQLEEERTGIKRERHALEAMRQDFEAELQAARGEVGKAQEALAASEERIRGAEALDRQRLEAEFNTRLAAANEEAARLREELAYRTQLMAGEMARWQQQAHLTAAAVMDAKNEVLERKRELDSTKEKMDRLLDKLYVGRERGMELQGAIAAAQSYAQHHHQQGGAGGGSHAGHLAAMAGLMPPAMLMAQAAQYGHGGGAAMGAPGRGPHGHAGGGGGGPGFHSNIPHSNVPKLPPVNQRHSTYDAHQQQHANGAHGSRGGGSRGSPGSPSMGAGPGPGGGGMGPGGRGSLDGLANGMSFMGAGMQMGAAGGVGMMPMGPPPWGYSVGPQAGYVGSPDQGGGVAGGGGGRGSANGGAHEPQAGGMQSRIPQPADAAAARKKAAGAKGQRKPPDRFEEGKRDEARLAAMAKRWQ